MEDIDSTTTTALAASVAYRWNSATSSLDVACCIITPRRKQSLADTKSHNLVLFQFQDNAADLSNLETLLVRYSPVLHLFVPEQPATASAKDRQIRQKLNLLASPGVLAIPRTSEYAKPPAAVSDADSPLLKQLVGEAELFPLRTKLSEKEWSLAVSALVSMLKSADCPIDAASSSSSSAAALEFGALGTYMRLDASTTRALNLFPVAGSGSATIKESSLFSVLDRTVTKRLGARMLHQWIKYPLCDLAAIQHRQSHVHALLCEDNEGKRQELRALLKSVPDLDVVSKRMANAKCTLEDLYVVYLFVKRLPELEQCVSGLGAAFELERGKLADLSGTGKFAQYCAFVESVIDLRAAPREFLVRSEHDDSGELAQLLEEREELDEALHRARDELLRDWLGELEAKWETDLKMIKTHGHHFRVPKKYDAALSRVKQGGGHTLLVVNSGIRWTTTDISQLSDRRLEVASQYQSAQSQFVKEAVQVASSYHCLVDMVAMVVAELDCYASLAHVASSCPVGEYVQPTVVDGTAGSLFVPNARHAMLELQQTVCESFIPNTHDMDRDKSRVQILTGPNMSGKSTFARQLGVLCVMAQIGSYIPCAAAADGSGRGGPQMPIVDAVLARVGASDSQLAGVSTFMAEMNETSSILSTVTDQSLVIIDELGRGTSTYDGFGLAWAISEHLAAKSKCLVIFATHFQELTALADSVPGVTNIHVDASVVVEEEGKGGAGGSLVMLHKVKPGRSEHSYGVNIARMAGFPKQVADNAQRKLDELDKFKGFVGGSGEGDEEEGGGGGDDDRVLKRLRQVAQFAGEADCVEQVRAALAKKEDE